MTPTQRGATVHRVQSPPLLYPRSPQLLLPLCCVGNKKSEKYFSHSFRAFCAEISSKMQWEKWKRPCCWWLWMFEHLASVKTILGPQSWSWNLGQWGLLRISTRRWYEDTALVTSPPRHAPHSQKCQLLNIRPTKSVYAVVIFTTAIRSKYQRKSQLDYLLKTWNYFAMLLLGRILWWYNS